MSKSTIVKNTFFLYGRMLLTMVVTLYTSRVILNALGIQDYGLYSVVGGIVPLFSFMNSAMLSATQRYMAIDIGKNDSSQLRLTFITTFWIHAGIALLVILLGSTIGIWFLNHKINIPEGRESVAKIVFILSLIAAAFSVIQGPYNSILIAKERMGAFTMLGIIDVIVKLTVAFLITRSNYDKLITYSALILVSTIFMTIVFQLYCRTRFGEARIFGKIDKKLMREMMIYSGWNLIGNGAEVAKQQGTNVMLNIVLGAAYGTVINAAYGVMMQVQTAVGNFVVTIHTALNPQIFKNYASGNLKEMHELMFYGTKVTSFLTLLLICPIIANSSYILDLWLKDYPSIASYFVQLTLLDLLLEGISRPLVTGALATGKIRNYQIAVGITRLLNVPFSYFITKATGEPKSFLYVSMAIAGVAMAYRLTFLRKMIDLDVRSYVRTALGPIALATAGSLSAILLIKRLFGEIDSFGGFFAQSSSIVSITLICIYFFGLSRTERNGLYALIHNRIKTWKK